MSGITVSQLLVCVLEFIPSPVISGYFTQQSTIVGGCGVGLPAVINVHLHDITVKVFGVGNDCFRI